MSLLVPAGGALSTAAGLGAVATAQAGTPAGRFASAALAAACLVLLIAGIATRRPGLVPPGVAFLGAAYAASLSGRALDLGAGAFGAGLLLVFELGAWAGGPHYGGSEGAVMRRRAGALAAAALVSAAAGTMVLGVSAAPVAGGYAVEALGAAAAVSVVVVVAAALRRQARRP